MAHPPSSLPILRKSHVPFVRGWRREYPVAGSLSVQVGPATGIESAKWAPRISICAPNECLRAGETMGRPVGATGNTLPFLRIPQRTVPSQCAGWNLGLHGG